MARQLEMPATRGPSLVFVCTQRDSWGRALCSALRLMNAAEQVVLVATFDAQRVADQLCPFWPDPDETDVPYLGTCVARSAAGTEDEALACLRLLSRLRSECWWGGFIGVFSTPEISGRFIALDPFGGPSNGLASLKTLPQSHQAVVAPVRVAELFARIAGIQSVSEHDWTYLKKKSPFAQVLELIEKLASAPQTSFQNVSTIQHLGGAISWDSLKGDHALANQIRALLEAPGSNATTWANQLLKLIRQ